MLELGPKLCPVERDLDRAKLKKDMKGFIRLKIKEYFYPGEDSRSEEEKWVLSEKIGLRTTKLTLEVYDIVVKNKFNDW